LLAQKTKIPVVMHNFKNYDCHLLLSSTTRFRNGYVSAIPLNTEKFISIICPRFYFVDSFMHLSTSLDTLTKNINSKAVPFEDKFSLLCECFEVSKAQQLSHKGLYPYEYMDSFDKFRETSFPDISKFYSSLKGEGPSKEDYKYWRNIFNTTCKNMGEYHDLYLKLDVLLLATAFENYRNVGLKNFKLDPVYYFSLPGYSWDAALFFSKVALELITDQDMYNDIELGFRGGVSMISHRYAEANNIYMDDYNEQEEDSFVVYIDKTNLYGEGLLQYLPVYGFEYESKEFVDSVTHETVLSWGDEDEIGRILVVDLVYPTNLHLKSEHNEYPLAPEKLSVSSSQLSVHQKDLLKIHNIIYSNKIKKLVPHLGNRVKYTVHYRNLKFYLEKGLILTKVHRIIRFNQKPWCRELVMKVSDLRKMASDNFEKDLFKLVINSIFGKSAQQVRNKMNVKIVNSVAKAKFYTKKANFVKFEILSPDVVIIFMRHVKVVLDKPIYTAFTVLEVSKVFMYDWHYNKVKKWYGNNAQFLFTDTDSLAYHIKTKDFYKDLEKHKDEFDFSGFDESHPLYSTKNKKVIGKMKDESDGKILYSFIGVSPKMYSFAGKGIHKLALKGVKTNIRNKFVTHDIFKKVLLEQKKYLCSMNLIRSKQHVLTTSNLTKVAIHSFDSKRFILEDGFSTLAHNHFLIPSLNQLEQ
jgi:hypothetical protein